MRSVIVVLALAACAGPPRRHYTFVMPPAEVVARLGPGDILVVDVTAGFTWTRDTYQLDGRGHAVVRDLGEVDGAGQTVSGLRDQLERRLRERGRPDARVTIVLDVAASPHVTISGQVQRPGRVRYEPGLTIVGAIVASGGFTMLARKSGLRVNRVVAGKQVSLRVSVSAIVDGDEPDLALRADDVVDVLEGDV